MAYKLYTESGKEVRMHDLQDKGPWCQTGATYEQVFVAKYGNQFGLVINPEKISNPYVPDLLDIQTKNLGDLKTQNTPFFQARSRYSLDPQYAVTFNLKDFRRYSEFYPGIDIYFWVKWLITKFEGFGGAINVESMEGIWHIPFPDLLKIAGKSPIHTYQQRLNDDKGNARDSYVINLNDPLFNKII